MGFIGNVLGGKSNKFQATPATNNYQAQQADLQKSDYANSIANSQANQQGNMANQQSLYNQFGEMAAGRGPSLAQLQLQQGLQSSQAAAAGQAAGIKGINPALAGRMALQNQSALAGQSAMASAQTRMQEQFGAMGAQAGLAGQMGQQNLGMLQGAGGLQQGQNALTLSNLQQQQQLNQQTAAQNANMQMGAQQINAGVAGQNANVNAGLVGGLLGGAASAGAAAMSDERAKEDISYTGQNDEFGDPKAIFRYKGSPQVYEGVIAQDVEKLNPGMVAEGADGLKRVHPALAPRKLAQGGKPTYGSQIMKLYEGGEIPDYFNGLGSDSRKSLQNMFTGIGGKGKSPAPTTPQVAGTAGPIVDESAGMNLSLPAGASAVGDFPIAGLAMAAHGGRLDVTQGGLVPGEAQYEGDTEANDVVPALLTPEEIVIPKSIAHDPEAAAEFVRQINAKDGDEDDDSFKKLLKHRRKFAEGGAVAPPVNTDVAINEPLPPVPAEIPNTPEAVAAYYTGLGHKVKLDPNNTPTPDYVSKPNLVEAQQPPYQPPEKPILDAVADGGNKYYGPAGVIRDEYRTPGGAAPVSLAAAAEAARSVFPGAAGGPGGPQLSTQVTALPPPETNASLPGTPQTPGQGPGGLGDFGYGKAFDLQSQAARDAAKVRGTLGAEQSEAWKKANENMKVQEERFQTNLAAAQKENNNLYESVRNMKVDPNQFWEDGQPGGGVGNKILGAISLIVGGAGAGLTGGPNQALAVIQRRIDQNIDAQKANITKGQNLLSYNLQKTENMIQAELMTRSQILAVVQGQIAEAGARAQGPEAAANAKAAEGQIQMARAGVERQLAAQRAMAQILTGSGEGPAQATFEALPPEEQRKLLEQQVMVDEERYAVDKNGKPQIDERTGQPIVKIVAERRYARSPEDAKLARRDLAANREVKLKLQKLDDFRRANPLGAILPATRQQAKSLLDDLLLSWNQAQEGLMRLNQGEREIIESAIANPSSIWGSATGKVKSSFDVLRSAIEQKRRTIQDTYLLPIR
jgi:hypothetical protein